MNLPQQAAGAAERAANAALYGGGSSAVVFGLTPGEWSVVGVIGGIIVGVLGLLVSAYFKWRHLKLAEKLGRAEGE